VGPRAFRAGSRPPGVSRGAVRTRPAGDARAVGRWQVGVRVDRRHAACHRRTGRGEEACRTAATTAQTVVAADAIENSTQHRVEWAVNSCDDGGVPLSEDEQRILRQIEQELEQDPTFSQRGYRVSRRRAVLLAFGLAVGLAITIAGLAVSYLLAFGGFVVVLVLAFLLESELRVLGRERLGELPISAWLGGQRRSSSDDER
jgi:hypothetical protein